MANLQERETMLIKYDQIFKTWNEIIAVRGAFAVHQLDISGIFNFFHLSCIHFPKQATIVTDFSKIFFGASRFSVVTIINIAV